MNDNQSTQFPIESKGENLGAMPKPSESFGSIRNVTEAFGSAPKPSEDYRNLRNASERNENHSLTVREAARMFEAAGVPRTERSIVNWCQPNPQGVARLDAYWDMNERRWFITPESVERAIAEEKAKAARHNEPLQKTSESSHSIPNDATEPLSGRHTEIDDPKETTELKRQLRDSEIANRVKDKYIERLNQDLERAHEERKGYIHQLIEGSHRIGQLETQVRQLAAPRKVSEPILPQEQHPDEMHRDREASA